MRNKEVDGESVNKLFRHNIHNTYIQQEKRCYHRSRIDKKLMQGSRCCEGKITVD
jgi:hypothetical protein